MKDVFGAVISGIAGLFAGVRRSKPIAKGRVLNVPPATKEYATHFQAHSGSVRQHQGPPNSITESMIR